MLALMLALAAGQAPGQDASRVRPQPATPAVQADASITDPAVTDPAVTDPTITELDAVVVGGAVTGPGLWRVRRDDGHEVWIMGTLSPLPAGITWEADGVRDLVSRSQQVLWAPQYAVDVKANIFRQALLGWGFLRAQRNPDGKTLRDVLPAALYTRWQAAKARLLPRDRGVERDRPIVAADALMRAAIARARLSSKGIVYPAVRDVIEARGIQSTVPRAEVSISARTAKAALAELRRGQLQDQPCLEATLDAVETDVPRMVANANAWARGDIAAIRLSALARREAACADALMDEHFSAKYGLPDIRRSVAARWMAAVEDALARNASTVAFVPLQDLLGPQGYIARLRGKGLSVEDPI